MPFPDSDSRGGTGRVHRASPSAAEPRGAGGGGSAAWLYYLLGDRGSELNWGLDREFFRSLLESKACMILLDGLDEARSRGERESIARLIEQAARAYSRSRFVVTSRPQSYAGETVLPEPRFEHARIGDLEWEAVTVFLGRWSQALFVESPAKAERHRRELLEAVGSRPAIRRMARNPVMLTALAVLHWNNKRLPEQRAELYESILTWLSRSRGNRPGRATPERCVALLQDVARAMQDHPQGRQVQVGRNWAAQTVAPRFRDLAESERQGEAEQFLREEEIDSGIVVSRGTDIRFWHLTFQEFLAARAIAGLPDVEQHQVLLGQGKAYQPEWREVVLLMAGILHQQGVEKVDALFSAVLDDLFGQSRRPEWMKWFGIEPAVTLSAQAQAAGLLGAVLRDLEPLHYKPRDPRYPRMMAAVLGIFDAGKAETVEFKVRLEAADALGRAGDPRLGKDDWVRIEAGTYVVGECNGSQSFPAQQAVFLRVVPATPEGIEKRCRDRACLTPRDGVADARSLPLCLTFSDV